MEPIKFNGQNMTFTKPKNMSEEECGDLPVFSNGNQIISCWKLSREEIEHVTNTGRIYLGVMGVAQPPVYLTTFEPEPVAIQRIKNGN